MSFFKWSPEYLDLSYKVYSPAARTMVFSYDVIRDEMDGLMHGDVDGIRKSWRKLFEVEVDFE